MRRVALVFIMGLLSACTTTGEASKTYGIRVSTIAAMKDCKPIGKFFGHSSAYGVFASSGFTEAKNSALRKAAHSGATHITWMNEVTRYGSTSVEGVAANCNLIEKSKGPKPYQVES